MSQIAQEVHRRYVFNRRTRVLGNRLAALLPSDGSVLDIGCGDGTIDAMILKIKCGISLRGVDVFVRPMTHIPVSVFDGQTLPYPDKSFDAVMFVELLLMRII